VGCYTPPGSAPSTASPTTTSSKSATTQQPRAASVPRHINHTSSEYLVASHLGDRAASVPRCRPPPLHTTTSSTEYTTPKHTPTKHQGQGITSPDPKRTSPGDGPHPALRDRLGTLVASLTDKFHAVPSWEAFVRDIQGSSYLSSRLDNLQHPAADLLKQMQDEGVPVPMETSSWTPKHKDDCVAYGCHKSAEMHKEFIR